MGQHALVSYSCSITISVKFDVLTIIDRERTIVPHMSATQIYVISWMFHLGKEDTGMHIYIDPWNRKQNEEFKSTETNYLVVPVK